MKKILQRFFYAWIFLTRFPAPPLPKATEKDWGRITPYFTLIGFIIGGILFAFAILFKRLDLPILFSSLCLVFLWILITGNLHLDGLMDTFDGIGCTKEERKIEAMKDSRVGAFGVTAGIFIILFKLVALTTILFNNLYFVILFTPLIARLVSVYSLSFLDGSYAKGLSSSLLLNGVKKPQDFIFNLLTFVAIFIFVVFVSHFPFFYIVLFLLSFLCSIVISHALHRHFKGHNGDTYGALIELSEVTILTLAVFLRVHL